MSSFSRETNRRPIVCHPYKVGRHCTHCVPSFLTLAFSSSTAFTFYYSMVDTTVHDSAAPVAPSVNDDDSGAESTVMAASSSPTCGTTKTAGTSPTEDDRRAYHDHGWLTGNLVSFIPKVDVPVVEGSTILCFESQLTATLGLPLSKFLSSIMNYLGCLLVHLKANAISALSSFIILCECWLGIPPNTSLFGTTTLLIDTPR
jgi:hypothetical protein